MSGQWTRLTIWGRGTPGAIVQSAIDPARLYAGTGAGVNLSVDGGESWRLPVRSASPLLVEALLSITIPAGHERIFAGGPMGLSRSDDFGESWFAVMGDVHIRALAAVPARSSGPPVLLAGTDADGILRSDDDGASWTTSNPGMLDRTVLSLATVLDDEDRQIVLAGTISGIYLSRNGGRAWRPVFTGEEGLLDIESIAIADRLDGGWTGLASSHTAGLLRSDDGGVTWLESPYPEPECGAIAVARSHTSPPAIAIAAGTSVFLSGDAGAEWDRVGSFAAPVMSLLALEHDALLAGVSGDGIKRVHLDDNVWTPADSGLEATFSATLAVIDTHTGPPVLFVASADADAAFSADLGKTWTPAPHDVRHAGAGDLLPASADGSLMLRTDHGLVRYSLEKEQVSVLLDAEISLYDVDADRIVAMNESGRIWASFDAGQTWTQHDGPPLPVGLKLSPPTNQPGMLAVACQVANASGRVSTYVAGMDRWDWARLPSETAVDPLTLVWVATSDQTVGVVLVCASSLHLYERRPGSSGLEESSWVSHTIHIASGVRFTNARPCCVGNALFFGTTDGVYCLDSMNRTLEPRNEGMRGVPVLDISPATIGGRRELLALCLGGSIWRTIV